MKRLSQVVRTIACAGTLVIAGVAHAASVDPDRVKEAIDNAGVGGNIQVTVNDEGVARLSGVVSETMEGQRAVRAANGVDGITDVIDLLRTDD